MEQVIFNGTQTRKPLGMAEVNLTIENNMGILPSEYTELLVSRRLYRSNESDYLLNKKKSRLKDITDLFLDTGLGADSYGIIEPVLIQRILTEDPIERRQLFEEAAGIAKYKQRVKTASRRLEGVNDNLERLNDILSEVTKNVQSLKRQYNQAKAYEGLKNRLEEIETMLLALERKLLVDSLIIDEEKLGNIKKRLNKQDLERLGIQKEYDAVNERLNENEKVIWEIREQWENYQSESIKSDNRILLIDEKERNSVSEREKAIESIERAEQRIQYLDERLDIHHETLANREKDQVKLNTEFEATRGKYSEAQVRYDEARGLISKVRGESDRLKSESSELDKSIAHLGAKLESNTERIKRLNEESGSNAGKSDEIQRKKAVVEENKIKAAKRLAAADLEILSLEEELLKFREKISALENQKSGHLISLERKKSEAGFLKSLIESGEDRPQGVNYLLSGKIDGIVESLGNILEVKPEYSAAIEAALGDAANAVIVDSRNNGIKALSALKAGSGGKATVIPLDQDFNKNESVAFKLPGVIGTADKFVDCKSQYRELTAHLLGRVLVVKRWEDALKVKESADWRGLIVTLEGEVFGDISITGGTGENKIPVVGRAKQVEKIEKSIAEITSQVNAVTVQIEALQKERDLIGEKQQKVRSTREEVSAEVNRLSQEIAGLEAESGGLSRRENNMKEELQSLAAAETSYNRELKVLDEKAAAVLEKLKVYDKKLREDSEELGKLNETVVLARDAYHETQLKLNTMNGEIDKLKSEIALGNNRKQELIEEIERHKYTIEETKKRLESLKDERKESIESAKKNRQLRDEWKNKLNSQEGELNKIKSERTVLENKLRAVSGEIERTKAEASEIEIRIAEIRSKIASREDAVVDKYGVDLEAVEPADPAERDDLESEMEKIKRRIANIGAVNLLAIDEYSIQKERLDFLQSEYEDIIKSKEELLETITRTNAKARVRFKEIFAQVSENFHLLFVDLFEGGEGKLSLGPGDPLEAEILLHANPAGKKLGAIEQMSGGEKTLTALAMLFSLYQIKPSPFCVLDEVDAPLDDANVDRFLKLIRRFSPKTQFILVTHNKITMEACDFLYGVTMQEEGVSKIISVEIKKDEIEAVA